MLRMGLFLWLLVLPAWAQTCGILAHIKPSQATFLEGPEQKTYEISDEIRRNLIQRGLGGRWLYSASGIRLNSALYRGVDPDATAGIQALSQFVQCINGGRWQPAHAMLIPATQSRINLKEFSAFWSVHTLSPHQTDWQLREVQPDHLVVSIHSTRGGIYDEAWGTTDRPTPFDNEFRLTKDGFRWLLDSYH